ncbi:unnamed protein product [Darwinula stevensoni]|uniref:Protein-lysine N-methyltransferase DSTB1V02_LOCUS2583 n=1 Tax=Darwinula stevensoni TaxID=69355 RepID=A0A7R9A456_9CRUS|nr:unnamed protein product [Darwinula stevensoni]CAG0883606.1 unnamed protein product [Darwinula stevensoni]
MATAADAGEFSSLSSREDELDLTSETFNPLKALRADSVEIPIPRAKIYDNLDQFRRHVLEGQASVGVPRPGGSSKSAKKLQKPQCLHSGTAEETPTLPEKESTVQKRNVLTRMKSYSCGPLGRLREIVDQRKRVRVWTRNYKEMRGHCTGFLIIFDKHWNLVLVDVEEVFQRKLHRKPLLPEGKLRGEFVKRMNLEDTKGETEKGDFSVMKADLDDIFIDMDSDDDDNPRLSSEALSALLEFYAEEKAQQEKAISVLSGDDERHSNIQIQSMTDLFPENWQLSQFWYAEETIGALSREVISQVPEGNVACISCPSLFLGLLKSQFTRCVLFEHDSRFNVFGERFIHYDYKSPLSVPRDFEASFTLVIADPPFLSEDCLAKMGSTIKFLLCPRGKIILCTGVVMEETVSRFLHLHRSIFIPKHKNNLGNEFACFANYDIDSSMSMA